MSREFRNLLLLVAGAILVGIIVVYCGPFVGIHLPMVGVVK